MCFIITAVWDFSTKQNSCNWFVGLCPPWLWFWAWIQQTELFLYVILCNFGDRVPLSSQGWARTKPKKPRPLGGDPGLGITFSSRKILKILRYTLATVLELGSHVLYLALPVTSPWLTGLKPERINSTGGVGTCLWSQQFGDWWYRWVQWKVEGFQDTCVTVILTWLGFCLLREEGVTTVKTVSFCMQ